MSEIARGAEAIISRGVWHDRDVVIKERVKKRYRADQLDKALRASRTRSEANLMKLARNAGVITPLIYDIDLVECLIVMEFLEGPIAKSVLEDFESREEIARKIGMAVGKLHAFDIVHGDLTTSNIIIMDKEPGFIDFGLGERSGELEKKGVDLHLLKEALDSAHSLHPGLFESVKSGYLEAYPGGEAVVKLVKEIDKRGRYT